MKLPNPFGVLVNYVERAAANSATTEVRKDIQDRTREITQAESRLTSSEKSDVIQNIIKASDEMIQNDVSFNKHTDSLNKQTPRCTQSDSDTVKPEETNKKKLPIGTIPNHPVSEDRSLRHTPSEPRVLIVTNGDRSTGDEMRVPQTDLSTECQRLLDSENDASSSSETSSDVDRGSVGFENFANPSMCSRKHVEGTNQLYGRYVRFDTGDRRARRYGEHRYVIYPDW